MAPMTFILQFCDPLVKSGQLLLQFLNFVMNRETPTGIVNGLSILSMRCWRVTAQGSLPLRAHGPSESRTCGYTILSRLSPKSSTVARFSALPRVGQATILANDRQGQDHRTIARRTGGWNFATGNERFALSRNAMNFPGSSLPASTLYLFEPMNRRCKNVAARTK